MSGGVQLHLVVRMRRVLGNALRALCAGHRRTSRCTTGVHLSDAPPRRCPTAADAPGGRGRLVLYLAGTHAESVREDIVTRHAEAPGRRMRYCFTHHEVWDTHHRDDACSDVLDLGGQHDPAELNRAAPMYAIAMASRGRPRRGTRSARGRRHA